MRVLIAPDKFKGSLTAQQVCHAIHKAIRGLNPALEIVALPVADGGEGTCEVLTHFGGGKFVNLVVRDPLFRSIETQYGISKDGKTAFIEMAKASGLQLLKQVERNPWITSTVGTGEMVAHALERGVDHIIIGIGGSATNDGGMGMINALGVRFIGSQGERLMGSGRDMGLIDTINVNEVHPRLATSKFTIICDVNNPLYGPTGAAHVFSRQKGADTLMITQLDKGLMKYEFELTKATGRDLKFPGAGAAGGIAVSLKAFASVEIASGMDFIVECIGLEQEIAASDVVITGEGKIDTQTLSGKVVKGIAQLTAKHKKKLFVIAGMCELNDFELLSLSIDKLITLTSESVSEKESMERAAQLITQRIREAWRNIFA